MFDFKKELEKDEEILYKCNPVIQEINKKELLLKTLVGTFLVSIPLLVIIALIIYFGFEYFHIFFLLCGSLFPYLALKKYFYIRYIKNKKIVYHQYCITNKRVMKHDDSNNSLVYGRLEIYNLISTDLLDKNYGDVTFDWDYDDPDISKMNSKDMRMITFESIENPSKVSLIAQKARNELLKEKDNSNDEIEEDI